MAANRVTFSLQNRQAANGEYTAELWVRTSDSDDWVIVSSNIAVNYNTAALTGLTLDPAHETNTELSDNFVAVTQTLGAGFARINLLKFPGSFTLSSGTDFHIATIKWDILDGDLKDDLSFITSGTNTSVFNSANQLSYNTGDANGYGVENPQSRTIDGLNITAQPQDQSACLDGDAEFSIAATGASLKYCWEHFLSGNWTGVTGATTSLLELNGVDIGMDGRRYRCVVKSASDTLTSDEAALDILSAPIIGAHPQDRTVCVNSDATFSATFLGSAPLLFNWEFSEDEGATWDDVPGASGAQLKLKDVTVDQDGNRYRVVISNDCGSITSQVAALTVLNTPVITQHPQSQTGTLGSEVTFNVETEGDGLTYQWQFEGVDITGAESASLTLKYLRPADAGMYRVKIGNSCGDVFSDAAELTLVEAPHLSLTAYLLGYWNGTRHLPASIMVDLYEGADLSTALRAARFTALLDADGATELRLDGVTTGDYWIVIRHGGHLAVVSDRRITLTNGQESAHDFTLPANVLGGLSALDEVVLNGTTWNVLRTGDMNGDLSVGADDFIQLLLPYFGASNPGMAPGIE